MCPACRSTSPTWRFSLLRWRWRGRWKEWPPRRTARGPEFQERWLLLRMRDVQRLLRCGGLGQVEHADELAAVAERIVATRRHCNGLGPVVVEVLNVGIVAHQLRRADHGNRKPHVG